MFSSRRVVIFSLVAEGLTALAALVVPALVVALLFGSAVGPETVHLTRVLGVALLALVLACWPGASTPAAPAVRALLAYNALAAVYLAYVGLAEATVGWLLWPAVVEHALVAVLLARGDARRAGP